MTALGTLVLCVVTPGLLGTIFRGVLGVDRVTSFDARERALRRLRRDLLVTGAFLVPGCAVLGALFAKPWRTVPDTVGSWFFASVCGITAWTALCLRARTREQATTMPVIDVVGRVVQLAFVPAAAVAWSLLAFAFVEAWVPMIAPARSTLGAFLSVLGLLVVAPWLATQLGLWRSLPIGVDAPHRSLRVAHLPVPSRTLAHVASVPWLRTVLVSDGLLTDVAAEDRDALVRYELGQRRGSSGHRTARWAVAILSSTAMFIVAHEVGSSDPRTRVAATVLAVAFCGAATWFTHRDASPSRADIGDGPSMKELARALRRIPAHGGQALPRTWHQPLSKGLYDRLFALGHDPGRRHHR